MTQPQFVPVSTRDRVKITERLPVPDGWLADRVGELKTTGGQPSGPLFGVAGPDQGYALKLVHAIEPSVQLAPGEHLADAVAGCLGVGLRRAALYGRAPVIHDLRLAFCVWGFLDGAPADLVTYRRPLFAGVAHETMGQRLIAAQVPETTLRLTPDDVASRLATEWRDLVGAAAS
jgi:hypothetical protein